MEEWKEEDQEDTPEERTDGYLESREDIELEDLTRLTPQDGPATENHHREQSPARDSSPPALPEDLSKETTV